MNLTMTADDVRTFARDEGWQVLGVSMRGTPSTSPHLSALLTGAN